jgi:hypothetical protein
MPAYQRVALLVCLAVMLVPAIGCGTGEYNQRLEASVAKLRQLAKFDILKRQPTEIPQTVVSVRIPKTITDRTYTVDSANPNGDGNIDPALLEPAFLKLPGTHRMAQASDVDERQVRLPYELYMSGGPIDQKPADLAGDIQMQLATAFPEAAKDLAWEKLDCETPIGTKVSWQRMRTKGEQVFTLLGGGQPNTLPGQVQVYMYEDARFFVVLVWRVPDVIAPKVPIDNWGPLVAGSLKTGE